MAGEQLRVTEGNERGTVLSVESDLLIGRLAPGNEGRLGGDPEISRRHARVFRGPGQQLQVEDVGSANGTFVNGERIAAVRTLAIGDVIRVGRTALEVLAGPAAQVEPPRPAEAPAAAAPAPPPAAPPPPRAAPPPPPAAQAPPPSRLVVTEGAASGRSLTLDGEVVLGRAVDGEGRFSDDSQLSRRHARVVRDAAGQVIVEDLGSANGTFVNGERLTAPRVLGPGDQIRIGTTTLQLAAAGARSAAPPPPPPAPPRPAAPEPPPAPRQHRPPAPPRVPVARIPEPTTVPDVLPAGATFAGCRVEELIGHGDMGAVYRAEELALQRPVALKVILAEYSSDDRFRERFRRESRIAAAIDHQNVIPVFDAGDENGVLYIMMRLVEGTDLRQVIAQEGALRPLRAARIVRQVGAALDAAHARGMLHRDVKPSNVLLARRDHVYLSDFGLAKPADGEGRGLTRQGTVVARAEYVAPEQVLGQRVDARADTYALGCLLFESLTGEPPFARWRGGPEMLAHVDAPPPSPRELRPDLPPAFDDVVRRAMAKDPAERYPSGGDLGQAALVAAGELRRPGRESIVAVGEAAPSLPIDEPVAAETPALAQQGEGREAWRWAVALAGLVVVAIGMIGALHGLSTL
jgi:pSer/pThr/pTyr-binding forkhead associated (FHA) protein